MSDYPLTNVPYSPEWRLEDLTEPVLRGAGPEPLEYMAEIYAQVTAAMERAAGDIRAALGAAAGAREGPAAEAGRVHVERLAVTGVEGAAQARLAMLALQDQASYVARVHRDMVAARSVVESPEDPASRWNPQRAEAQAAVAASDAALRYQDNTNHNTRTTFPVFVPPPESGLTALGPPSVGGGGGSGGVGAWAPPAGLPGVTPAATADTGGAFATPSGAPGLGMPGAGAAGPSGPLVAGAGPGIPAPGGPGMLAQGGRGVPAPGGRGSPGAGGPGTPGAGGRPVPAAGGFGPVGSRPGSGSPAGAAGGAAGAGERPGGAGLPTGGAGGGPGGVGRGTGAPTTGRQPLAGSTGGGSGLPGRYAGAPPGVGSADPSTRVPAGPGTASATGGRGGPGMYGAGMPFAPGAGRGADGHTRPPWLLEDDPDEIWFAGLPAYTEPVISAEPPPDR